MSPDRRVSMGPSKKIEKPTPLRLVSAMPTDMAMPGSLLMRHLIGDPGSRSNVLLIAPTVSAGEVGMNIQGSIDIDRHPFRAVIFTKPTVGCPPNSETLTATYLMEVGVSDPKIRPAYIDLEGQIPIIPPTERGLFLLRFMNAESPQSQDFYDAVQSWKGRMAAGYMDRMFPDDPRGEEMFFYFDLPYPPNTHPTLVKSCVLRFAESGELLIIPTHQVVQMRQAERIFRLNFPRTKRSQISIGTAGEVALLKKLPPPSQG